MSMLPSKQKEADCKHSKGHVSSRPVVMALAGPVSHDRAQCRKSKVEGKKLRETQREEEKEGGGDTESERRAEEGKEEVKECNRG